MKKILFTLLLTAVSLGAAAQFEKGTKYVNASISDFGLSYSKVPGFSMGIHAGGGYFVADNWMLQGQLGWGHVAGDNTFNMGAGVRYCMKQNGLFFSGNIKYGLTDMGKVFHNAYLTPEVGYCFYLNDHVSLEPSVYVDMCLNRFKDFTKVGLKLSFGYYF